MKNPEISFIIRTRNEAKHLANLIKQIKKQEGLPTHEFIIIDNDSHDNIKEIARRHDAKLITIASDDFTYPRAWNLGVRQSRGQYLVFMSAHIKLADDQYINQMYTSYTSDKVAGVYGNNLPMKDAPLSEKLIYTTGRKINRAHKITTITKAKPGVFGTANATTRGDLMRATLFDESYAAGGEDEAWARRMISEGYVFVRNGKMAVHHSHYLPIKKQIKQMKYWKSLGKPKEFSREAINSYKVHKY